MAGTPNCSNLLQAYRKVLPLALAQPSVGTPAPLSLLVWCWLVTARLRYLALKLPRQTPGSDRVTFMTDHGIEALSHFCVIRHIDFDFAQPGSVGSVPNDTDLIWLATKVLAAGPTEVAVTAAALSGLDKKDSGHPE